MADDVTLPGTGDVVAADEVAGAKVQRVKLGIGDNGAAADASDLRPVPVAFGIQKVSDFSEIAINCASSGNNEIVALTGGQTIRVYGFFLVVAAAVSLKWRTASTDLHPALPFLANGAWVLDPTGRPWFTTVAGEALNLNLSAAVQVSGRLYYTKSA